jgi:hypothetical protein
MAANLQMLIHPCRRVQRKYGSAMTGASTKEVGGADGPVLGTSAALGYQHATEERERLRASKLDEMVSGVRAQSAMAESTISSVAATSDP